MNKFIKYAILSLLLVFCFNTESKAQDSQTSVQYDSLDWIGKMQDPNVSFWEVQKAFNAYWKDRPYERSKGYKQYKRWEYFMEPRVGQDGERIDQTRYREVCEQIQRIESKKENRNSWWSIVGPTTPPSNGGDAGRINAISFHPTDEKIIYSCSPSGGVWKTTDGGSSWFPLSDKLPVIGATDILVNQKTPDIIYLATGDGDADNTYSIGVMKSEDAGYTWNPTGLTYLVTKKAQIFDLEMHPTNENILFAATSEGIYKTIDAGNTWDKVTASVKFRNVRYNTSNSDIVYALSGADFYKSTDGGETFEKKNLTKLCSSLAGMVMAVAPSNQNYIYLISSDGNRYGGNYGGFCEFFASTDGGETFTSTFSKSVNGTNLLGWTYSGNDYAGQGFYDLAIVVDPTDPKIVYVGGVNIWKTTDGGRTFQINAHWNGDMGIQYVHADIHYFIFAKDNKTLWSGTDGGVYVTSNGGTKWEKRNNGLAIAQIYRFDVDENDDGLIISGWQDNGTNLKKNDAWKQVLGGDGMDCFIDYSNPSTIYGSIYYGDLRRSTDGGNNFTKISGSITETGAWVTPFIQHPTNSNTIFAGYESLWKSTDRGSTWAKYSTGQSTKMSCLAVSKSNPDVIFIASGSSILKTTNGGQSWTSAQSNLPTSLTFTSICINPYNENDIWVTFSGYNATSKVFHSTNGGESWDNITGALPNIPANCIIFEDNENKGTYLGTDVGVYYRNDDLGDWVSYNNLLPNVIVYDLKINYTRKSLFAATYGRGVWQTPIFDKDASIKDLAKPNYRENLTIVPNPASTIAEIRLENMLHEKADLKIVDMSGRIIYQAHISPHFKSYALPVETYAKGVYMVTLKTQDKTYTGKLIKVE